MKRVNILSDMHLRSIRTKLMLMSRNEEATKHLEVSNSLKFLLLEAVLHVEDMHTSLIFFFPSVHKAACSSIS